MYIDIMALIDKLGRLARLAGILGLSLGSLIVSACNGGTKLDGESDGAEDVGDAAEDSVEDVDSDARDEEVTPGDAAEEEPDTDLWEVICE
ncbi:MAG: hypothetical protein ABIJ56_23105 [Pseudomonadota bacterium]